MKKNKKKTERRNKIRRRIRSTIRGTSERPRLSIFKSNKHVYLQLINDRENATLLSMSTKSGALEDELKDKSGVDAAHLVGKALAEAAKEQGINKVVYDRSGYKYHGVVKAAADGAREGGLDL
ncbi:50S ribosomal protein L18 [Rhodohalobacter halophilus]|uniref:50S ribosomal protein L18 n=1 Tax=Rhodohalobacter halophilus TaxID=1812810 RepID=UPI00083F5F24|nr:50S ribosomal protein L18 [Rhodohalobacter halophilus]